ncbi:hypothetical protein, partial [Desulfosporosinus sp.]|uniref:hypothetical protein n=1 Tax=Desulfosporosinus sp. TaxID=157907 RepID=UPI0025B7D80E
LCQRTTLHGITKTMQIDNAISHIQSFFIETSCSTSILLKSMQQGNRIWHRIDAKRTRAE